MRLTLSSFGLALLAGLAVVGQSPNAAHAAIAPIQAAAQTDKLITSELATPKNADSKPAADKPGDSKRSGDDYVHKDAAKDSPSKAPPTRTGALSTAFSLSKRADDETFLRRASMDLLGQPPTPAEITSFVLDPSPNKRAQLVDRLLAKSAFGENWGRYWRDVIMYRRSEDRALLAAPALTEYLTEQFNKDVPWDQVARSFITATGDVRENGATGLIAAQFGQTAEVTAEVSRIFMGIEIQCANCHNHPTDRWKRTQFHELAAFFPRLAIRPVNKGGAAGQRSFEVAGNDRQRPFAPKNPNLPGGEAEHYMPDLKNPSAKGTLMQPVFFLTGQKLPEGSTDAERRSTIAKWITSKQDPWFAKAFVNRIWAELVGEGFFEPVDDIGPDRDCVAPKTLDYLANQFVGHDYDVKWLFRTIMATAAYQRESRSRHLPGETAFVANCPQRLRGDELFSALMSAVGLHDDRVGRPGGGMGGRYQPRDLRGMFNAVFGYDPSVRRDEVTGSIPQALLLMNSPQLARAIDGKRTETALGELLSTTKSDEAVTTELYLRCLAREPKSSEMDVCLGHVKKTGNRAQAFEDILWALVNSTEFLHRK